MSKEKEALKLSVRIGFLFISAAIVYYGWNYFFTDIFGLRAVSYWEAFFIRIFIPILTRPAIVYTRESKS